MKIIIIEDEVPATEKLERYILKHDPSINIVAKFTSVSDSVSWLQDHQEAFDLAFMDIQLTDGLSFDIFSKVSLNKPVIFTTAFDEYAIDAFKVNSIDYILKPITFTEVSAAINKFKNFRSSFQEQKDVSHIVKDIAKKSYKERFLVKLGNHIHSIKTSEIALFYADGRTVYLVTNTQKKYIVDYKLEDLYQLLDKHLFFRTNRTYIVNINAIEDVLVYSNSRLKIGTKISVEKDIIVSREKVSDFKKWFEGS